MHEVGPMDNTEVQASNKSLLFLLYDSNQKHFCVKTFLKYLLNLRFLNLINIYWTLDLYQA